MCDLCRDFDLSDAMEMLKLHGYRVVGSDAPREYAVSWDDRIVAVSQDFKRAEGQAKQQAANGVGRWEVKQRFCGPWEAMDGD